MPQCGLDDGRHKMSCYYRPGRLWFNFDSFQELEEWKRGKDVRFISIDDTSSAPRVSVIFEVDRKMANQVLGYEVDELEWLELEPGEVEMTPFERDCLQLIETIRSEDLEHELPATIEHLKTLAVLSRLGALSSKGEAIARMSLNDQRDSLPD